MLHSPYLNPWVYQQRVRDIDELRRCLIDCWTDIQQTVIDDAVDEWRAGLIACVRARDWLLGHLLASN